MDPYSNYPDLTEPTRLILSNYRRLFHCDLVLPGATHEETHALFESPFVMLSALGPVGSDHVFNYANRAALQVFEAKWSDIVGHPSSESAEPVHREERRRLLDEVERQGFIKNYSGIRVSRKGRRFRILRATVFNLLDSSKVYIGQAATFTDWESLSD